MKKKIVKLDFKHSIILGPHWEDLFSQELKEYRRLISNGDHGHLIDAWAYMLHAYKTVLRPTGSRAERTDNKPNDPHAI